MTADNTSSEFALLTYAHHIVDTLANRTSQVVVYPSTNNFNYYRIHPIFAPAGMGGYFDASFRDQSQIGFLWSSSVSDSVGAFYLDVYRSFQAPQPDTDRCNGLSLRCVDKNMINQK